VKYYNTSIADNDKVEFIHASKDDDKKDALGWAKSAKLPWLTVLSSKIRSAGLAKLDGGGVPGYSLIDKNGKVLATNERDCMAKIKELTGK